MPFSKSPPVPVGNGTLTPHHAFSSMAEGYIQSLWIRYDKAPGLPGSFCRPEPATILPYHQYQSWKRPIPRIFPCFFHTFQLCYGFFQRIVSPPVVQIKIQIFYTHALRKESSNARSRRCFPALFGRTFGYQKKDHPVFIRNDLFYKTFRFSISIHFRCIDQRHACRNTCAQTFQFPLSGGLILSKEPGSKPQGRNLHSIFNVTVCFILDQTCFFHFFLHLVIRRTFWCWKIG